MSDLRSAIEALRRLEWSVECVQCDDNHCPACHMPKGSGHATNCWLAAALAASSPSREEPGLREVLRWQCPKCGSFKAEQIPPFHYCQKTGHHEQMSRVVVEEVK